MERLLCVITFTPSHRQGDEGTMVGSVLGSERRSSLLLNLIKMANMTDDEEDSTVKPSRERNPTPPTKHPIFFFF